MNILQTVSDMSSVICMDLVISNREIGRRLQRSHTTIGREVARNKAPYARYWYSYTHDKAIVRRRQNNLQLMSYIKRQLEQKGRQNK